MHSIEFLIESNLSSAETVWFYDSDSSTADLVLQASAAHLHYKLGQTFLDAILETFQCTSEEFGYKFKVDDPHRYVLRVSPISYGVYKKLLIELAALKFQCERSTGSKSCKLWEKAVEWEALR